MVIKLLSGENVKLGAVGGSITWGFGVRQGHDEYVAQLTSWLRKAFPKASISARNGAVPATTSAFMNMCYQNQVDADVDLLFVEYRCGISSCDCRGTHTPCGRSQRQGGKGWRVGACHTS